MDLLPWLCWSSGKPKGRLSRQHNWSTAGKGRGIDRLEKLSEPGQNRASQHWSLEGKRSGKRKWPIFNPLWSGTKRRWKRKWPTFNPLWSGTKRSGKRKWPTFNPLLSGTICVQPQRQWHWLKGNFRTPERQDLTIYGLLQALTWLRCHIELKLETLSWFHSHTHSISLFSTSEENKRLIWKPKQNGKSFLYHT